MLRPLAQNHTDGGVVRPQDLLVTQLVLSLAYLHLLGILGIMDLKISKEHISALKHFCCLFQLYMSQVAFAKRAPNNIAVACVQRF